MLGRGQVEWNPAARQRIPVEYRDQLKELRAVDKCRRSVALRIRKTVRVPRQEIPVEAFKNCAPASTSLNIEGDAKKLGDVAHTFVALHYSPFLMYCVRQIRNLIMFLSLGFLLLVISLSSYDHQSRQFIGRALRVLFYSLGRSH